MSRITGEVIDSSVFATHFCRGQLLKENNELLEWICSCRSNFISLRVDPVWKRYIIYSFNEANKNSYKLILFW